MKYSIVLKRLNDETRFINFDTADKRKKMMHDLFEQTWNLIFEQTSDAKFASTLALHLFASFKIMFRFHRCTHNFKIYQTYKNFQTLFLLIREMLTRFNYWTKEETHTIFLLRENTNVFLRPDQILLEEENDD